MIASIVNYSQKHPYISLLITLIGIFLYQSLNLFWGFELADSGYHLTAFENVFDAPDSVSDNFTFYLTNVIGGAIMKYFPEIGVFGFRVVGVVFVNLSLILIFLCLKNELPVIHILIGSVLVVLCYIPTPYSFNNGICSCFFYVCFSLLIYKGIIRNSLLLIFLGGVLVGVNIFSRIPNVLAIGLIVVILFHRWITEKGCLWDWKAASMFLVGVVSGILCVFLLIHVLGHEIAFREGVGGLFMERPSSYQSHTFFVLIIAQLYTYFCAIIYAASFFAVFYVNEKLINHFWTRILFITVSAFVIFYHVYLNFAFNPLWALCFVGCLICLYKGGSIALLGSLAFYMLIVEILGSDSAYNHGSLPAMLAAPISSYVIINRRNLIFVLITGLAIVAKVIKQGNYFDYGSLVEKRYALYAVECSHIWTSKERADIVNKSLPQIRSYVHPQDTLLVYGSAPMLNYLTHTRPAGGVCWPGPDGFFIKPFVSPPKMLIQKKPIFINQSSSKLGFETCSSYINEYMREHPYRVVFENEYFLLLLPE